MSLGHYAAIILVEIQALLGLQASVSTVRKQQATAAQSEGDYTSRSVNNVVGSDAAQAVPSKISDLEKQVRGLYDSIKYCNRTVILGNGQRENPGYRSRFYSSGSRGEAYIVTGFNISAWLEAPDPIEMMEPGIER